MEMIIFIFSLLVLIFSAVVHEVSHGAMADFLGDPTAKMAGRLTLNPLKHLDPFGSVILPAMLLFLFSFSGGGVIIGWAKPVPINPFNFRDKRWGTLKVSLAGPASNIIIAVIFGLIIRFFNLPQNFADFLGLIVFINFLLALFNLIPIPPLDGSWILFSLLPRGAEKVRVFLQNYGLAILIFFIFFGLQFLSLAATILYSFITGQAH